jgi:hypothetical protein
MKIFLASLVLVTGLAVAACGGGSPVQQKPPPPAFAPVPITGQWEFEASDAAGNVVVTEANLAFSSTDDFGASSGNTVTIDGTSANSIITLESLGLACDNGGTGFDTVNGTFTSAMGAAFTVFDQGPTGMFSTTGTLTFNATGIAASGTYSNPAACGVAADSGMVAGVQINAFNGEYAGMLNAGANSVIVTVTEDSTNYSIMVSGTDNGAPLNLTGMAVGGSFQASGTDAGQPLTVVGFYDSTGNDFLIYSTNPLTFDGYLHAGTNPTAAVTPHRFVGKR